MTHVTCRLTAKNRDQLRNPTLSNQVWATFTFYQIQSKIVYQAVRYGILVQSSRSEGKSREMIVIRI